MSDLLAELRRPIVQKAPTRQQKGAIPKLLTHRLTSGGLTADELRDRYVNAHTNCLDSLGYVGRELIKQYPDGWKRKLRSLYKMDWSRQNRLWEDDLIQGGKTVRTTIGIALGACTMLEACGSKIPEDLARYQR